MATHPQPLPRFGAPAIAVFLLTGMLAASGRADIDSATGTPGQNAPDTAARHSPVDRVSVTINNAKAGWLATGLSVSSGETVALFGSGTWDAGGLTMEPRHLLWYRVGEYGAAYNFSANQEIFTADASGQIFVTLRPLGVYWEDVRGPYPHGFSSAPPLPVAMSVTAIKLDRPAEDALAALASSGDADARRALEVIEQRRTLPEGFVYLPYLGRSNVWAAGTVDQRAGIRAETSDDAGIVKLPLDIPLSEDTEFSFAWRYDSLPALGPETEAQFHDYISIALEFDNGQDLTWMWSRELPPGTHFSCPLPWWDARETHYVLQSGRAGLATWQQHTRNVLADYRESISVPAPSRIVGIWFIANSLFGRQVAAASFSDVRVVDGNLVKQIFPGDTGRASDSP